MTSTSPAGVSQRTEVSGLAHFGAVLLVLLAFFNGLDGIAAIYRSRVFVAGARFVVGDLRAWGWVILILAILQLAAAVSIFRGETWGRWFGVVILGVNAFAQMWFVPAYPFWSLTIIAVSIAAIYGLTAHGGRRRAEG
ncbi:hypothetical protein ABIA32_006586 [Streptacidiphilus sp. MAP12-20]|uniref:DUF7144 family membrane protein n=1 Tax=Streptacidiphilus sp. MAP12-20 TaxID=3156299 RepID=UPI003513D366